MEKSNKSAIIIAPPISLCDQIQEIRRKHDRAYERWMPHINMVYPFYEDTGNVFAKETVKLTMQLSGIKPFKVSFTKESIGFFRHNTRTIVWIRPLMPSPTQSPPKKAKTPQPKKITKPKAVQPPVPTKPVKSMPDPKHVVLAPKSFPKPAMPVVQHQQHTLIGYPEPVPSSTRNYAPATGLDALCKAVWTPEDTQREIRIAQQCCTDGLDALRFAFCGLPEGKEQAYTSQGNQQQDSQRYMTFTKVLSDVAPVQQEATQAIFSSHYEQDFPELPEKLLSSSASSSEESDTSDSETSETSGDEEEKFAEALPDRADGHHPHVMLLQHELERNYPDLNDLGSRSETGFQPHLTLGQFDNWKAQTFIADLKKKFVEFTFEVNELQIISRIGNLNPFKVKMTVPLGGNQASILI